jgi:hypothetical protein
MAVTVQDRSGRTILVMSDIDTYGPSVNWESVVRIVPKKLTGDINIREEDAYADLTNAQTITVTVSGEKNPASSNTYVQIVSAHLFWKPSAKSSMLSPNAVQAENVRRS